jgi:hypothetical protein
MTKQNPSTFQQHSGDLHSRSGNYSKPNPFPITRILWLSAILSIWGLSTACNLTGGLKGLKVIETSTDQINLTQSFDHVQGTLSVLATQTAQALPPSQTPIPPTPSPTSPSETPTPTNTPISPTIKPPTQAPDVIDKIKFRTGGTSAYFQKSIESGDQHQYTIRALKGQTLILTASSPGNDVVLDIKGLQGGQQLKGSGTKVSYWTGTLPQTQEYLITLSTINPDTSYFLTVEVPANIYFEVGAFSDTINGYIEVDKYFHPDVMTRVRYRAYAFAGQMMTVELSSPNLDDLSFGIYGQDDGQVYTNYQVKNSGGEVKLPTTQGYYLDVYSTSGESTSFTLKVTIK